MKIIGICGYSGSGKTTLLKQLIPLLKEANITVAVIKHSHHDMDIDIPGKDSYELRKSGATQTIVACDKRWALVHETPDKAADLITLTTHFNDVDLVLVEGFKDDNVDKIICHRHDNHKPLYLDDHTIAIVTDIPINTALPQFDLNSDMLLSSLVKFITTQLVKIKHAN